MNDQPPSDYVREVLRRAYAAFNARDIEVVLSLMHQDVEWPNGMEGGYVYGHDSVRAYWTRQWGLIDPIVEPQAFGSEPDGRIVVEVRQRVLDKDGSTLSDGQVRHVYSIRDGLVRHMEIRDPGAREVRTSSQRYLPEQRGSWPQKRTMPCSPTTSSSTR